MVNLCFLHCSRSEKSPNTPGYLTKLSIFNIFMVTLKLLLTLVNRTIFVDIYFVILITYFTDTWFLNALNFNVYKIISDRKWEIYPKSFFYQQLFTFIVVEIFYLFSRLHFYNQFLDSECVWYVFTIDSRQNALIFNFNTFSGKKVNLVGTFRRWIIIQANAR